LYALREKYADEMSEDQRELLDDARSDAEHLNELMTDLLELTEIESGSRKLNLELMRPCDLVQPAVDQWRYAADFKHVKIASTVAPDLPRIMVDRGAMKRVFDNLLSNAIRHTGHDGRITISAEEREHRIIFSISDTGEGIPAEYLPNIFGRFVR